MIELMLITSTVVLAHATYLLCPPEQRPWHALPRLVVLIRDHGRTVAIITARRVHHHGRWLVWQVTTVLRPQRSPERPGGGEG